jgi:hypothetical protein
MTYCENCGAYVAEILKFCPSCGTPSNAENEIIDHKISKKDRYQDLKNRVESYKPMWDKDGVIQFKTEYIAILQRKLGMWVEFIIAFEDLTREGYELKAIDRGTESSYSKGVNSFYYFQKFSSAESKSLD